MSMYIVSPNILCLTIIYSRSEILGEILRYIMSEKFRPLSLRRSFKNLTILWLRHK